MAAGEAGGQKRGIRGRRRPWTQGTEGCVPPPETKTKEETEKQKKNSDETKEENEEKAQHVWLRCPVLSDHERLTFIDTSGTSKSER